MARDPALLLHVVNDAAGVATALDRLEEFLRSGEFGSDVCGRVMVVADEVMSNIVRCAFPDEGRHSFTLALAEELADGVPGLRLLVEDAGIPFDPTAATVPDTDLPLEEREIGGLGMHLVRSMSRSLCYTRRDGLNRLDILLDAVPG